MEVSEFLNTKLVNYASYDNVRSIGNAIDGLKNASRKILYTVHEKKIRDKIKVSQLSSKCAEFSDYLHGDASLQGVIVTLGQDFAGTNNIPLLRKFGNFGTRSAQKASAPRYIFAKGSDEFFELFKYEDDDVLESQTFEGYKIEPKFYVPTLPMILINGSEGISTGFAQKILPRNPDNIKKYIKEKLNGNKPSINLLDPWFKGFNGTVTLNTDDMTHDKWKISGVVEHVKRNEYLVKEVPLHYDLTGYISILDELKESGKILRYSNESDGNNTLQFRVWMPKNYTHQENDENLYDILKLTKCVCENFTCIDEFNKIREFTSSRDVIDYYIGVKLRYTQKRKDFLLKKYRYDLSILECKLRFISMYIKNEIKLNNVPKTDIETQLNVLKFSKVDDSYNYLIGMPLYSLTSEKIQSLKKDIDDLKNNINNLNTKTVEDIWATELEDL